MARGKLASKGTGERRVAYSSDVSNRRTSLRGIVKAVVPQVVRHWLRRMQAELPVRLRDLPGDVADRVGFSKRPPLPPAALRSRVGRTRSRSEYSLAGRLASRSILEAFARHGRGAGKWLDFGCGSGRIARFLIDEVPLSGLVGTDVDPQALLWCGRHLRGDFVLTSSKPLLPFQDASFDVIVASSVFTHLDHAHSLAWLSEMQRTLRQDGILVASTHSERLSYARPDLTVEDLERLRRDGFVFRPGTGRFNDDCSFHTRAFLEGEWGRLLDLVEYVPFGHAGFQDLSIWRRR